MNRSPVYLARRDRVMRWFAPARFGLFYHYGLFTGGGCSVHESAGIPGTPLFYKTPAEFDAATPDPETVARNLVGTAADCGARYVTLTALHSGEAQCVLFPAAEPHYLNKTRKDYIGSFLREAHRRGLRALLYCPLGVSAQDIPGVGPTMTEDARTLPGYYAAFRGLLREMRDRYGDLIDGIWLDGRPESRDDERASFPAFIRTLWPEAVIVNNGDGETFVPDVDFYTSEEYEEEPLPPYNRWGAYRRNGRWGATPPRRDFNEDIPHVGKDINWWWSGEGSTDERYTGDRFFLLRQLCASVGQRGLWNFAPGIGPTIDGSAPAEIQPSLDAIRDFLAWASPAVFGTRGGERSVLTPGFFNHHNSIGFAGVTQPYGRDDLCYALVTQAPTKGFALFETDGYVPRRITDLRTGDELPFDMWGSGPYLEGVDWSDVDRFGAKVLVFEF